MIKCHKMTAGLFLTAFLLSHTAMAYKCPAITVGQLFGEIISGLGPEFILSNQDLGKIKQESEYDNANIVQSEWKVEGPMHELATWTQTKNRNDAISKHMDVPIFSVNTAPLIINQDNIGKNETDELNFFRALSEMPKENDDGPEISTVACEYIFFPPSITIVDENNWHFSLTLRNQFAAKNAEGFTIPSEENVNERFWTYFKEYIDQSSAAEIQPARRETESEALEQVTVSPETHPYEQEADFIIEKRISESFPRFFAYLGKILGIW